MATARYKDLYEDIFTQVSTFLGADATYSTKDFKRLEEIELEDLESSERWNSQEYQFDLLVSDITSIDEDTYFNDHPEENEICGGFNTTDGVNGSGYYDVQFTLRVTQPNKGFSNDNSLRFTRPAIGNDILIDIFEELTGHTLKDHNHLTPILLNDKSIILSQSTFTVVTSL